MSLYVTDETRRLTEQYPIDELFGRPREFWIKQRSKRFPTRFFNASRAQHVQV